MTSIQMMGWPVVTVSFNRPASVADANQWFTDLSELLTRQQPFSMIIQVSPQSQFSASSRRQFGLWFKGHRGRLGVYCRGVVRVVRTEAEGERVVSDKMKQAMPFPMAACLEFDQARKWAIRQVKLPEIHV